MFKKVLVSVTVVLLCLHVVWGQDTTVTLPDITITGLPQKKQSPLLQVINREDILKNVPQDLGCILQKVSGVALKSYGGLGGMKTISVRGLGSQHTQLIQDGFLISNTQTGQMNLATVQTDNIEYLELSSTYSDAFLLPASAYTSGSILSIYTFENSFTDKTFQLRSSAKKGSFGETDIYASSKISNKRNFVSLFGKYRCANGRYPYSTQNGTLIYEGIRLNNDFEDWYGGVTTGIKYAKKGILRISGKFCGSDQGLPGAVILYNSTANQRLTAENKLLTFDLKQQIKQVSIRLFAIGQQDFLHYTDPSFLNNSGGISSSYMNQLYQGGISMFRPVLDRWDFYSAIDTKYSKLDFSDTNQLFSPQRNHNSFVVGTSFKAQKWNIGIQLASQWIKEIAKMKDTVSAYFHIDPGVNIETKEKGVRKWSLKAVGKSTFRMPSFNELYYNGIGNVKLKPEKAVLFSVGFKVCPVQRFKKLNVMLNTYCSFVRDQIVAIPTKNLFVWSMQNIGKTNTYGGEIRAEGRKEFTENWQLQWDLNYTFQRTLDITDSESPSYKGQLPYIPVHTGNMAMTLNRKNTGFYVSYNQISKRYSLNENIEANEISGFILIDISLFQKIYWRERSDLRIQFTIKNIANKSYEYVRSYVMPGRSYLLSLTYAIH